MPLDTVTNDVQNKIIGERLKAVRESHNLSQRQLGKLSSVANATISQIESGRINPTVGMLKKVLDGISFSLSDFFAFGDIKTQKQVFFKERELINIAQGGISYQQVGGNLEGKRLQLMRETYQPGANTGKHTLSHEGEECGIVLSGRLTVTVSGITKTLSAGDSYYFSSEEPHQFKNEGHEPCSVISACTPPTF